MPPSTKLNLTIERMIYGGDGFARLPAALESGGRGKAVFIPFVAPGESVEASIVEESPGFVRARAERIVSAAPIRVQPECRHFLACGGCQYQHIAYEQQVAIKSEILRETLRRTGGIELATDIQTHAASPWRYRNRARLHVTHRPRFAAGYYRFHSNELLPIEECPISAPLIATAIDAVNQIGGADGMPEWVREIEIFVNHDESALLAELFCDAGRFAGKNAHTAAAALESLAEQLSQPVPQLVGLAAFEPGEGKRGSDAPRMVAHAGAHSLQYRTPAGEYRVSAGSFFQANRYLLDKMVNLVTSARRGNQAIDLYAGAGLFSIPLANAFDTVKAVEAASPSFADLQHNAAGFAKKIEPVQSTTERFLRDRRSADYVVVDPPRGGLGSEVCKGLARMDAPRLCYVSCDPATMARDLKQLLASGYRIDEAHLIDMFPQTFHIESIFQLVK